MSRAARKLDTPRGVGTPVVADLLPLCADALTAAETLRGAARQGVGGLVLDGARVDGAALEREQFAAHGFAWFATYIEALRQTLAWAERLAAAGRLGEAESLVLQIAFGEYLSQLGGGIPMSQGEVVRPGDMNVPGDALRAFDTPAVRTLTGGGNTNAARMRLAELIGEAGRGGHFGDPGLDDGTLEMVRDPKCKVVLTLSGAMTIAKMGRLISKMIDTEMVHAIVSTGALMAHGLSEAVGLVHYRHDPRFSDEELFRKGYNRVHDTLEKESNLDYVEAFASRAMAAVAG